MECRSHVCSVTYMCSAPWCLVNASDFIFGIHLPYVQVEKLAYMPISNFNIITLMLHSAVMVV